VCFYLHLFRLVRLVVFTADMNNVPLCHVIPSALHRSNACGVSESHCLLLGCVSAVRSAVRLKKQWSTDCVCSL
jgi:hypothetical protein